MSVLPILTTTKIGQLTMWELHMILCPVCGAQADRRVLKLSLFGCCEECDLIFLGAAWK